MTTTDQRFEERLLSELRAVVEANPSPAPAAVPSTRASRLTRTRVMLGGAASAAAAVATAVVLAGSSHTSPAYAVEPHADGSVTVTINSLRDAAGLQRELRDAGVPAVVDYVPEGKACRQPRFKRPTDANGSQSMGVSMADSGATTFTIGRDQLHPGQTLVIENSPGKVSTTIGLAVADGPVGPCELVDAPAQPAPTSGGGDRGVNSSPDAPGAGRSTRSAGD